MSTLASYKRWLKRNEFAVQLAELLVSRGSWLLPDRFNSMEAPVELFRSLSGAVSVFHEHLLASTAVPAGSVWLAVLSQFEVLVEMGALRLESTGQLRSKYTVLLLLEAVKTAIKAQVFAGTSCSTRTWAGVTDIQDEATFQEQLSTALRAMHEAASAMSVGQHSKQGLFTPRGRSPESPASENARGVWWQNEGLAHKRLPHASVDAGDMRAFGSEIENESPNSARTPTGGGNTIKAGFSWQPPRPDSGASSSDPQRQQRGSPYAASPSTSPATQYSRLLHWRSGWSGQSGARCRFEPPADAWRKSAQRLLKLGESLAIIRPLLYVALLRRYGSRSWTPWTVALMCEGLSHALTTVATRQLRKHQETEEATRAHHFEGTSAATLYSLLRVQPLAHSESELRRRRWLLAWFLLRDPFYRKLFWPQLKAICKGAERAPLVGGLFGRGLEIVEGVQKYYAYTSGS